MRIFNGLGVITCHATARRDRLFRGDCVDPFREDDADPL
jgi:hypothetical protein